MYTGCSRQNHSKLLLLLLFQNRKVRIANIFKKERSEKFERTYQMSLLKRKSEGPPPFPKGFAHWNIKHNANPRRSRKVTYPPPPYHPTIIQVLLHPSPLPITEVQVEWEICLLTHPLFLGIAVTVSEQVKKTCILSGRVHYGLTPQPPCCKRFYASFFTCIKICFSNKKPWNFRFWKKKKNFGWKLKIPIF